ncbi:hypothetical protein EYC80_010329 [Monilinia laxa]|uniref:FAD/NAD(P)-binding domain-containing protein n=1 Tax=Monilinia laxa TaxID=61186 RepID=A0A5N6JNG6_MONLA|nr:hypothetical protein EYC80_010329 [Monilinia laxa]
MALTPPLAPAAYSTSDFRIAEEPARRRDSTFKQYQALVSSIDFKQQTIRCTSCIEESGVSDDSVDSSSAEEDSEEGNDEFNVKYDKLILAPGCETNTFGTPGVKEYALLMNAGPDARRLRERILECLEWASLPSLMDEERRGLLHFVVVGGGPTGIRLAAEIDELIQGPLGAVYPRLQKLCTVSIYDVADRLPGQSGEKLSEYAREKFKDREGVKVRTGKHIQEIKRGRMVVRGEGDVPFGVLVWAAGNTPGELVQGLQCRKSEGSERILTDRWLRVLTLHSQGGAKMRKEVIKNVYALGDAADMLDHELPTTAEVAVQKAMWLTKHLLEDTAGKSSSGGRSEPQERPFSYQQTNMVACIGLSDGVAQGKKDCMGAGLRLPCESGSLGWMMGWRKRVVVAVDWAANLVDGREFAGT